MSGSGVKETYGKGGLGNVGMHVQHAVEDYPANEMGGTSNTAGKGGMGNIKDGAGHYDASGGHEIIDASGRGGAGNIGHDTWATTGTNDHTPHKVTAADKLIGSAQIAIGKMTHNPEMITKGETRKADGKITSF